MNQTVAERELRHAILEAGFSQVGRVEVGRLRYDPEIRRICEENRCGNYGATWACPPMVGTLEQCRQRCEQYTGMLLFNRCFPLEDSFDFEGMRTSLFRFMEQVDALDRRLRPLLARYQLLSNEGCGRCKRCTCPDAPCRFPDRLYHSLEGYGFSVSQLAQEAGIRYYHGKNTVTYFGALLFREERA